MARLCTLSSYYCFFYKLRCLVSGSFVVRAFNWGHFPYLYSWSAKTYSSLRQHFSADVSSHGKPTCATVSSESFVWSSYEGLSISCLCFDSSSICIAESAKTRTQAYLNIFLLTSAVEEKVQVSHLKLWVLCSIIDEGLSMSCFRPECLWTKWTPEKGEHNIRCR